MSTEPTTEGTWLIDHWRDAERSVASLKSQLNLAECSLINAQNSLGRWLVPEDAQMGEKFSIWYDNELFITSCEGGDGQFSVTLRKRLRAPA